MSEAVKYITSKKISLDNNEENKKLAGLYKINSDLLLMKAMIERSLQASNTFLDCPGIVIIYRKCFESDARKACLKEKKHLRGMTDQQKEIHNYLIFLGNKHVAHPENDKFDPVTLNLILDGNGKALAIEPTQDLWEPLGKKDLEVTLELVNLALCYLGQEVWELGKHIIDEYNIEHGS